jgi:glycosyltransferase involved in cell wall biosynthesis
MALADAAPAAPRPPLLSVIVPVYNEAATVDQLLERLLRGPYPDKEVIVVDDGSADGTADRLARWATRPGVLVLRHDGNLGKGAAVRTGLAAASGDITVIQDADMEYDPQDFPTLVEPIRLGQAEVVYGSRYLSPQRPLPWTRFRLAVCLLNWTVRVLYGQRLTDEATCYKALPTRLLRALDLQATRFELCPEITGKVCRLGVPIFEVPISYTPRTTAEGKKIRWRDGVQAAWTLLKWRFAPLRWSRASPLAAGPNARPSRGSARGEGQRLGPAALPGGALPPVHGAWAEHSTGDRRPEPVPREHDEVAGSAPAR